MRHLTIRLNITWVMQHLNVAIKYIEQSGKGTGEATGGSDYKIKYQRRIFFQSYGADELANWGEKFKLN
jgi:tryptophan 2,3-dioxygenase